MFATPLHRDRTIDALRAVAIAGVVLGHWLVTAVVAGPSWRGVSPLSSSPGLVPATWVLQTLAPFFFAGGYAAACGLRRRRPWPWLSSRLSRLSRPVLAFALVWAVILLVLWLTGVPSGTRRLIGSLVIHPLWFLAIFLVLTALTPLLRAVVARWGVWSALSPAAVVGLSDVLSSRPPAIVERGAAILPPHAIGQAGADLSPVLAMVDVLAGWAVPYLLGIALADRALPRRAGAFLLPVGVVTCAGLVLIAGYPASAVGVPGDGRSNLAPPTLFAVGLGLAQIGAFLLVRPWLRRVLERPVVWVPVVVLNLCAMTAYCWHQTAMLLVTFAGGFFGALPGLHDLPGPGWVAHRLVWLPAFAVVLVVLGVVFHRFERARPGAVRATGGALVRNVNPDVGISEPVRS
ncbi:acyltransferase [Actinoplanes sp. OR16]|uniref:acyltransferase family protein n=1 Tax=Actinoplanes sp. OR16 TaxID=946334 RepID=UPI000FDC8F96|nr:acyltransferase [Actinoplanes sp. OR16]